MFNVLLHPPYTYVYGVECKVITFFIFVGPGQLQASRSSLSNYSEAAIYTERVKSINRCTVVVKQGRWCFRFSATFAKRVCEAVKSIQGYNF
jgi:hypothetical protein